MLWQVLAGAEALARRSCSSSREDGAQPDAVLPDDPPPELPGVDAARAIPRCAAAALSRARFQREFWKADAPVIITGEAPAQSIAAC